MRIQLKRLLSVLKKDTNQAHELGKYAINFMEKGQPSAKVLEQLSINSNMIQSLAG